MDANKRFDQLESLLADLARQQDQQMELLNSHSAILERQERRLDNISEQIGDIITILKISETRHTQAEQRQDTMLVEIHEQGRRLDEALNVQLQMLQLMRVGNEKTDDLARRLLPLENQEPRLKRLEDEVFKAAS